MAILLSIASGRTVETNKATLQRLARDKGDRVTFNAQKGFEDVLLNGKAIGRLFDSHEKAIQYLANLDRLAGGLRSARTKGKPRTARRNPGTDLTPMFTKPIGPKLRKQILAEIRGSKLPTLADKLSAAAKRHGIAAIRIYTIAKAAGLTTTRARR